MSIILAKAEECNSQSYAFGILGAAHHSGQGENPGIVSRLSLCSVSSRCPAGEDVALLGEAMNEGYVRHFSGFRVNFLWVVAVNHREVNVVVDVNVFDHDSQAGGIPANVTRNNLKITHHD
jgi:hypothetical protein